MNVLHDYVAIKVEKVEKTEGGLYVPQSAENDVQKGEVIKVGPGTYQNGNQIPACVRENDVVYFSRHAILFKVKELVFVRDKDIFLVE